MDELTKELIQVAASFAVGCASCLEHHVSKARELGAKDADLEEVLTLARGVKLTGAMKMDELAEELISSRKTELKVVGQNSSCGCGSGNCC